ncbi:MAG TPA: CoA-binding protein, partial [Anaerolineae bacterium]|nr:CoA-binding protein [Anaerolineae bacterium]
MLAPFFNPAGVAVIGASGKPGKLGYGVVRNLIKSGYRGAIYPVNPKAKEILGLSCYPAIADTPDPLDLAIIVVAAPIAAKMLQQCGQRGVKHAIVVSGGFKELGAEGAAREEELIHIAQQYGIRLIGPNCIGTIDTHTPLNTTFLAGMPAPGDIAFMSQSGAMCAVVIDWAQGAGVGFSRIVSSGNQSDVNESDLLAALNDDLHTRVIAAYIEGVSDGRAFMQLAARVARNKPIVALKGGRGESGLQAVASHTGSLAGSAEAYAAAFKQSGVLQARTTEDLLYWARALAWQPLPSGKNVAVLTNAGGPGIAAVDALEVAGLQLAPLSAETRAFLRAHLPPAASVNNPVDILAGSGPQVYGLALEALLQDPAVDAALVISAPNDWYSPAELAEVIADVAEGRWGEGEQGSMGVGEQGSRGVGERRKSKGQRTRDKGQKPVLVSLIGSVGMEEAWEVVNRRR